MTYIYNSFNQYYHELCGYIARIWTLTNGYGMEFFTGDKIDIWKNRPWKRKMASEYDYWI